MQTSSDKRAQAGEAQCAVTLDSHGDALDSAAHSCGELGNLHLDLSASTMGLPASGSGYHIMAFPLPTAPEEGLGNQVAQVGWGACGLPLPRGLSLGKETQHSSGTPWAEKRLHLA